MLRRLFIAVTLTCAMVTNAAATSISTLNEIISMMRLHTGIMEGPVEYSFTMPGGDSVKLAFVPSTVDKQKMMLRAEIREVLGYVTQVGKRTQHRVMQYVAVYEDHGPDGVLDSVAVRTQNKQDLAQLRKRISTAPSENQEFYDELLHLLRMHLRRQEVL